MTEITARLSTALADRYQIESRLGEGGMPIGSSHYMSPEQTTAKKDLTSRSDI